MISVLGSISKRLRSITKWLVTLSAFCLSYSIAEAADYVWERHVIDDELTGADGVRVADVNGDGFPDVATGWEESGEVRIYLHPGVARVKARWPRATVGVVQDPEDAFFADVDGDGVYDVISSTERQNQTVYVHWAPQDPDAYLQGQRWRTTPIQASRPGRWSDIVSYICDSRIGRFLRVRVREIGRCVLRHRHQRWMFGTWMREKGELPGLLFVGSKEHNATISMFQPARKKQDVGAWKVRPLARVGWTMSLLNIDIDEDGYEDILFSDRRGADLDGNGVEDDGVISSKTLVLSLSRGVYWLRNPNLGGGSSVWPRHTVGGEGEEVMFLSYGDLDQDRHKDILAATKSGPILFFRGLGKGVFQRSEIRKPRNTGTGKGVAIGDIDLDGKLDLVYSTESATGFRQGVVWIENPGHWDLEEPTTHDISGMEGSKFDRIELLDLDGDGDLDVLTTEEGYGLGVIWYENPGYGPKAGRRN